MSVACREGRALSDLLTGLPGARVTGEGGVVRGVTVDSRAVRAGDCFVALRGTREDGGRYVDDAFTRGAAAAIVGAGTEIGTAWEGKPVAVVPDPRTALLRLCRGVYGDPDRALAVWGVTGTNGKTTVSWLLRSFLASAKIPCGLIGTVEYDLGGERIPSSLSTPDVATLFRFLARMREAGCASAVLEASSHGLLQGRLGDLRLAGGIFTNLTRDHLDYHPTMEAYRDAKGRLFEMLPEEAVAVLNLRDPVSKRFREITRARTIGYGPGGEVSADEVDCTLDGTSLLLRFDLDGRGGAFPVRYRPIGEHNVENLLAAAAAALATGIDPESLAVAIGDVDPPPGRLEPIGDGLVKVLVDYAHTDDALRRVLGVVRPFTAGRLIVVFGCGGDRDRGKRPMMARAAEEHADRIWVTSDNPRSEDPHAILDEIAAGLHVRSQAVFEADRASAIRGAILEAEPGDCVVVAGKGHERQQVIAGKVLPFDDREEAYRALEERS